MTVDCKLECTVPVDNNSMNRPASESRTLALTGIALVLLQRAVPDVKSS